MALKPGEDLAATLFADVHYFYGKPSARPAHHRFDKGSYVYLLENPSQRRARVEIANNAGTADQDAFDGYLDGVHIQYSYKQTNLVTLTVESPQGQRHTALEPPEWHLPTFDPKNENKYMYKLHSLDIYFFAKEDALVFVNAVRRMLPIQQVTVLDEPVTPAPHHEPMSPTVQKLENVAVTDPSYHNGQTKNSKTTTLPFFAGPPVSVTPEREEPTNFAPMAYNPAAPAAPEAIKHREKTPPPEDAGGNPLVAAAAADQYGQQPGFPGPPGQHPSQASYFPQGGIPGAPSNRPPTSSTQSPFAHHFQNQFAPPPTQQTSPYSQQLPTSSPNHGQPGAQQQFTSFPLSSNTPSAIPSAVGTPGSYSQMATTPQHDPDIYTPPPGQGPPGGYASFNYGNTGVSSTKPMTTQYGVHDQVYRPTEIESTIKHNEKPIASVGPKPPQGKLEARASKLEKGLGGMFKKLEKKYG